MDKLELLKFLKNINDEIENIKSDERNETGLFNSNPHYVNKAGLIIKVILLFYTFSLILGQG